MLLVLRRCDDEHEDSRMIHIDDGDWHVKTLLEQPWRLSGSQAVRISSEPYLTED